MEKELKEYTCQICHNNLPLSEMYINKYHIDKTQKPAFQQIQDYCKNCFAKKKYEKDMSWRNRNLDSYKKYQAEYHRNRKKDKLITLVNGILLYFKKHKTELNIPDEVLCKVNQTFKKSFLFIEKKDKFRDWAIKNKIENSIDFRKFFNENFYDAFKFCQEKFDLQFISKSDMIKKRVKYNSDNLRLLKPSDKDSLKEKLKKDSNYNQSVIVTYLYFINNKVIADDFVDILLPESKIQNSNMFGKQIVNYNGKKYIYYRSSAYATKYVLRKFEINFKDIDDKRELIYNYVNTYIKNVCKNPEKVGYITNVIMAGYNRLMFDIQNQIDEAKKRKK